MERRGSSGAPDRQHPCFAVAGVTDSKAPDLNLLFFFSLLGCFVHDCRLDFAVFLTII